jgi:hypothetical protein
VEFAKESRLLPGSREADFVSPISISANTTYVATYYCPVGQGAWDQHELDNGVTNSPLTAPAGGMVGGNGVYISGNACATIDYAHDNYYVDVVFVPAAGTSPSLMLRFDPPIRVLRVVLHWARWWQPSLRPGATTAHLPGHCFFAQPYSNDKRTFAISGNSLIVNPSGPGLFADANTTLNVTIVATQ